MAQILVPLSVVRLHLQKTDLLYRVNNYDNLLRYEIRDGGYES